MPVEEVYEALRRLKYRAAVAMAEWRREEAQAVCRGEAAREEGSSPAVSTPDDDAADRGARFLGKLLAAHPEELDVADDAEVERRTRPA